MAEYIEKQAAISLPVLPKEYRDYQTFPLDLDVVYERGWDDALECVEKIPPADVRPVVRGHWICTHSGLWQCSNPKCKVAYKARLVYIKPNFCPNCGADMRGGDADGDEKD